MTTTTILAMNQLNLALFGVAAIVLLVFAWIVVA